MNLLPTMNLMRRANKASLNAMFIKADVCQGDNMISQPVCRWSYLNGLHSLSKLPKVPVVKWLKKASKGSTWHPKGQYTKTSLKIASLNTVWYWRTEN